MAKGERFYRRLHHSDIFIAIIETIVMMFCIILFMEFPVSLYNMLSLMESATLIFYISLIYLISSLFILPFILSNAYHHRCRLKCKLFDSLGAVRVLILTAITPILLSIWTAHFWIDFNMRSEKASDYDTIARLSAESDLQFWPVLIAFPYLVRFLLMGIYYTIQFLMSRRKNKLDVNEQRDGFV